MSDIEVDRVTILAITGDQYTFENVEKVGYDETKESFIIEQSDGTFNLLPRENMVIFAKVPKQSDDKSNDSNDKKIILLLDRPAPQP